MSKTKIEWVRNPDGTPGYTINPVKGLCPMGCSYCYARRMYKRFKWNPEIRYEADWKLKMPLDIVTRPRRRTDIPSGSKIFLGSTMELFGDWVQPEWMNDIMSVAQEYQEYTFIFLTKQPQNLAKWSPFPDNCWVGASATDYLSFFDACNHLYPVKAPVRFISFEPLLTLNGFGKRAIYVWLHNTHINWLIIGQQTPPSKKTEPKIDWIREIVEAADRARVPVFLKDNLMPLLKGVYGVNAPYWSRVVPDFPSMDILRQEFPKV